MKYTKIEVETPQGFGGLLRHSDAQYLFDTLGNRPESAVALSMPNRAKQFASTELLPIFQMNIPEGRVLEEIRSRLAKTSVVDPMLLLSITGSVAPIGRLSCKAEGMSPQAFSQGERLEKILAWDGTQDLFRELFDKYVLSSGISGVQPKVLVPETIMTPAPHKVTTISNNLIVKSGQEQFPHLAINEFICMSIAKEAGIETADFYLSDNRQLFVSRRFDRTDNGPALGFEDMAVLTGRQPHQKYEGSYESLAKVVEVYASEAHRAESLRQLFKSVALSLMIGNGDAHLKNFGLIYTHPLSQDIRLSPAFDIVNTTVYIPEDAPALTLSSRKSFFASRVDILPLAKSCGITDLKSEIEKLVNAAHSIRFTHKDLLDAATGLEDAIMLGTNQYESTFVDKKHIQRERG